MYTILAGEYPFKHVQVRSDSQGRRQAREALDKQILAGRWNRAKIRDKQALALLQWIFLPDPALRPTMSQVLGHAYFTTARPAAAATPLGSPTGVDGFWLEQFGSGKSLQE